MMSRLLLILWCAFLFVGCTICVVIIHDCPYGERYKSCMFYPEYTCWDSKNHETRSRRPAKKLEHCWGGCVCKYEMVRAHHNGPCVNAHSCSDQRFRDSLAKMPHDFVYF